MTRKLEPASSGHRSLRYPIDVFVGSRIRMGRVAKGLSQLQLGQAIGATLADVRQYELGTRRVSDVCLGDLSNALDVPVRFFFDSAVDDVAHLSPIDPEEMLELVSAYCSISNQALRQHVVSTIKSVIAVHPESA